MHDLKANFDIIYDKLKFLTQDIFTAEGNLPRPGPEPKFSDLSVMSLSLTAEYLSIDSENHLFAKLAVDYAGAFTNLIDRTNYNRRKRKLFQVMERVRKRLVSDLNEEQDYFIIDSEPLPICCFSRASRSKTCQEVHWALPSFGYCASQQQTYYGYKLHAIVSPEGVIEQYDLSPAHQHDIGFLQDAALQLPPCQLIGDKAYLSADMQQDLWQNNRIALHTPKRRNQKDYRPFPKVFRRLRKRIETVFSQLDVQFNTKRNLAITFSGLRSRIVSKVTAFTLVQHFNKFVFHRSTSHVKIAIY